MTEEESTELAELWQRRDKLNKADQTQLYQLVSSVLKQEGYPEIETLPLSLDDYIDKFFESRIVLPATGKILEDKTRKFHSEEQLQANFRRYLSFVPLAELWQRRDKLNKAEWTRLHQLVRRVLKQGSYSELSSLPSLPLENYIDGFFCSKVFMPTTKEHFESKPLVHENVLKIFFKHYLIDLINEIKRRKKHEISIGTENNEGDDESDEKLSLADILAAPPIEDDIQLLKEHGLTLEQVTDSARQFLQQSEDWVLLYMALHICRDEYMQLPLKTLAQIFQIPSYHYRAGKLGITRKKGEFEKGYEKTLLGQWLLSLGLSITNENKNVIQVAFQILCCEAYLCLVAG